MSELLDKNLDNVKSETDLFGNRIEKLSMKDRIGFLPISIWQTDWTIVKELKAIVGDDGSGREGCIENASSKISSRYFKKIDGETFYNERASIFNPHFAQMILSAYCPTKANIFDPFGGGGTRGFVATAMGHKYHGVELRQNEVDRIKEQQNKLGLYFDIVCADSRKYPVTPQVYDFCYTCPPYYNLEIYSDLPNDLSNIKMYGEFMGQLRESINTSYVALKNGSLSCWVVGNFRDKDGYLTHFNSDLIWAAKECGYKLHDEIVLWSASGNAVQRCGNFLANRKSVRVHEYLIVLKKP